MTRTPCSRKARVLRLAPLAVLLCLCASPAGAQVDDALIQRYADLNVQAQEITYLRDSGQIDGQTYTARHEAIYNETRALDKQLVQLSFDAQRQARDKIDGLTRTRLATLRPQWDAKINQARNGQRQRTQDVNAAITADAQKALAPQRRRLELQQQRDRGEITPEQFAAEDKKAVDDVMALRAKYATEGQGFADRFDSELARLTAAVAKPAPPKSAPRAQTPKPAPPPVVTNGDVRRAMTPAQPPQSPSVWSRWSMADTIISVVVGSFGVLLLYGVFRRRKAGPGGPRLSDVHGTAHWAPLALDAADACLAEGIFLGKSSAPDRRKARLWALGAPICSTPEHHTLIVARTRTGKGTRVIIPTLLRYRGSALVIDPKGENAAVTARIRQESLGQNIHILNPWNELAATYESRGFTRATYNPLDVLDKDDPNVVAIAQTLAATICPAPAGGKDRFWQGSAANMLTAVLLWLAQYEPEHKTLGRAREIVSLTRKELRDKFLIPMAASEAFDGAIKEMAAPFIDLAQETYSGVMSNLSEATRFLSDPQMKAATAASSFSMADLATKRATVYVVIPAERMDTQKTWLRLVIASAMQTFKRERAQGHSGERCLFLIDEFAALGRIDDLPRDIATMSGFGLDFALIVQGLDQLKDHYHEAAATILSNCAYKWFCNVGDLESAKYLSDTLGKKTVQTVSRSESSSTSPGPDGRLSTTSSNSVSYGETGRSLLNPDEILNLGKDVAIALQPHGHAHCLKPIDYWILPDAFTKLREMHPEWYWEPTLAYDENPYHPGFDVAFSEDGVTEASQMGALIKETKMTDGKARKVLGLGKNVSPRDVTAAYMSAMQKRFADWNAEGHSWQEIEAAWGILLSVEKLGTTPVREAIAARI